MAAVSVKRSINAIQIWWRQGRLKDKKSWLPVDVPRSKTLLLKLSNITPNTLLQLVTQFLPWTSLILKEEEGRCKQKVRSRGWAEGKRFTWGWGLARSTLTPSHVTVRIVEFWGSPFPAPYSPQKTRLKIFPENCLEQQDLSTTLSVKGRSPCPSLPEACYVVQNKDSLNIIVKS